MERVIRGEMKERWGTTVQRNKNKKQERTKEMETEKKECTKNMKKLISKTRMNLECRKVKRKKKLKEK